MRESVKEQGVGNACARRLVRGRRGRKMPEAQPYWLDHCSSRDHSPKRRWLKHITSRNSAQIFFLFFCNRSRPRRLDWWCLLSTSRTSDEAVRRSRATKRKRQGVRRRPATMRRRVSSSTPFSPRKAREMCICETPSCFATARCESERCECCLTVMGIVWQNVF